MIAGVSKNFFDEQTPTGNEILITEWLAEDLGVKKGIMKLEQLSKLPTIKEMNKISLKWKPYRTFATWYLWIIAEGPIEW